MTLAVPKSDAASERYERRRSEIIAAATALMNIRGVRGMRLADVASELGMSTTGVTHYFRHKDDLAFACFEEVLASFEELTAVAAQSDDSIIRVTTLLRLHIERAGAIRAGLSPPSSFFGEIGALSEPAYRRIAAHYGIMLENIAKLFDAPGNAWMGPLGRMTRAQLVLEQVFWTPCWLGRYALSDYPRVIQRMNDILVNGIAMADVAENPTLFASALDPPEDESGQDLFLDAATRVINTRGYAGASVVEISAQLNRTKGAFYRRHETKDELVVACFKRSFDVMQKSQEISRTLEGNAGVRLASTAASLMAYQFRQNGPLLRTTTAAVMPAELRRESLRRTQRAAQGFASMIADGIAEQAVRPIDQHIGSQMLVAMCNAAADSHLLPARPTPEAAADLYAKPLMMGLFQHPC